MKTLKNNRNLASSVLILCSLLDLKLTHANEGMSQFDHLSVPGFVLATDAQKHADLLVSAEPDGNNISEMTPRCRPELIESLAQQSGSISVTSGELEGRLAECTDVLGRGLSKGMGAMTRLVRVRYHAQKNPNIREVLVTLKNGIRVSGLLGLKNDSRKRPFVIAQCGVMCGINDPMASMLVMQVFEETPFNVLVLENQTSLDYARKNRVLKAGGIEEGLAIVEIALNLKSEASSLQSQIDSLHVVGQSLGGHAALYAALFGSEIRIQERTLFQSVLALNPVVNLAASFKNIQYSQGLIPAFGRIEFSQYIASAGDYIPSVKYASEISKWALKEKIGFLFSSYLGLLTHLTQTGQFQLPEPLENVKVINNSDVENLANFSNHFDSLKIPTLVFDSTNDPIVRHDQNSGPLREVAKRSNNSYLGFVSVNSGSHCAQPFSMGWGTMAGLIRGHILKYSPNFVESSKGAKIHVQNISDSNGAPTRWKNLVWKVPLAKDYVTLVLRGISAVSASTVAHKDPVAARLAQVSRIFKVHYDAFGENLLSPPNSEKDAKRISRWLNSNAFVANSNGESIFNGTDDAKDIFIYK